MPNRKTNSSAESPKTQRRQPTQVRAQQTIQTLFKAAAQILDRDGEAALSTNKVAAAAGFSIGTLYQYFPSKEALLKAMAERGQQMVLQQLEAYLAEMESSAQVRELPALDIVRQALHILIEGFAMGKGLGRSLVRLWWTQEQPDETASAVRQVSDRLAIFFERIRHPDLPPPSAAALFVLTRSVIGTLRSASLEKSPLLGSAALEDGLLKMALALLMRPR